MTNRVCGDSPEAKREQGEAYAKAHNIIIIETIILLQSASRETQPMQKVIDVCKDKSKGFQVVLIKSIDRFTRGGGDYYSPLKRQLTRLGIALEDMYGVIGKQQINTLEHTGFKYYCLLEVWQNPFWQCFTRQDGRVLSGVSLQS